MAKTDTKTKTTRKTTSAPRRKKAPTVTRPIKQISRAKPKATKATRAESFAKGRPHTKQAILIAQLRRKEGATIAELTEATGWQAHSVRGAISGALKKKLGLSVTSEKVDGRSRVYRIVAGG